MCCSVAAPSAWTPSRRELGVGPPAMQCSWASCANVSCGPACPAPLLHHAAASLWTAATAPRLCSAAGRRWTPLRCAWCRAPAPAASLCQVPAAVAAAPQAVHLAFASLRARGRVAGLLLHARGAARLTLLLSTAPPAGDYSRPPLESDTQVVRAAVLLDELLQAAQRRQSQPAGSSGSNGSALEKPWPTVVVPASRCRRRCCACWFL